MRALVVGGNGFIGSHLVDRLARDGWDVVVLDASDRRFDRIPDGVKFKLGDFSQRAVVEAAVAGSDIVYHLAWTTIPETSHDHPAEDIASNLIPSIQLFRACLRAGVGRVVFVSSGGTVYGGDHSGPIREDFQQDPITPYGISKLTVEKYLHFFWKTNSLDYMVLRPSVPYGPRQNPHARQGAASVFLYRVANELPITIWGDGSIRRDYFYISDLVDALVTSAVVGSRSHRIFNIGGGVGITLNELVASIERVVGRSALVSYSPQRDFDAESIVLDTRRAADDLGWQAAVELTDGLAMTYEWMKRALEMRHASSLFAAPKAD